MGEGDKLQNAELSDLTDGFPPFSKQALDVVARISNSQDAHTVLEQFVEDIGPSLPDLNEAIVPLDEVVAGSDDVILLNDSATDAVSRVVRALEEGAIGAVQNGSPELVGELAGLLPQLEQKRLGEVDLQGSDIAEALGSGELSKLDNPLSVGALLSSAREAAEITGEDGAEVVGDHTEESSFWDSLLEKILPEDFRLPAFLTTFVGFAWKKTTEKFSEWFGGHSKTEVLALTTASTILGKEVFNVFFEADEEEEKEKSLYEKVKSGLWGVTKIATLIFSLHRSMGIWVPALQGLIKGAFEYFGYGALYESLGAQFHRFSFGAKDAFVEFAESSAEGDGVLRSFFEFFGYGEKKGDTALMPKIPDALLFPEEGGVNPHANLA